MLIANKYVATIVLGSGETTDTASLSGQGFTDLDQMVPFATAVQSTCDTYSQSNVTVSFDDINTVRATRAATGDEISIRVQVVQFGNGVDIQVHAWSMGTGDLTDAITLSPAITVAETFAIHYTSGGQTADQPDSALTTNEITSTTNCTIERENTGSVALSGHLYVISCSTLTVTKYAWSKTSGTTADQTIPEVDPDHTAVFASNRSESGVYPDEGECSVFLLNSTTLRGEAQFAITDPQYFVAYVVEDDGLNTQHFRIDYTAAASGTQAVTSVTVANSIVISGQQPGRAAGEHDATSNCSMRHVELKYNSSTQTAWTKEAVTDDPVLVIIQTIEFPATTYKIEGVTKTWCGAPEGSCDVYLYNGSGMTDHGHTTSHVTTGAYSFTGKTIETDWTTLAFKNGTKMWADTTDSNLSGVEEAE